MHDSLCLRTRTRGCSLFLNFRDRFHAVDFAGGESDSIARMYVLQRQPLLSFELLGCAAGVCAGGFVPPHRDGSTEAIDFCDRGGTRRSDRRGRRRLGGWGAVVASGEGPVGRWPAKW